MKITCNLCDSVLDTDTLKEGVMYYCSCKAVGIDILDGKRTRILAESDKVFTLDKDYTINGELHERKEDTANNKHVKTKSNNRRHASNTRFTEDTKR